MIALFDSGNSGLHFAWWDGNQLINVKDILYPRSPLVLMHVIDNLLDGMIPDKIVACSVSSRWREALFSTLSERFPDKCHVARSGTDLGISIKYKTPDTLGIDRVLAGYAGYKFFHDACVVIDAGTAITIDCVTYNGTFMGGYIFPGWELVTQSLSHNTDLPYIASGSRDESLGTSTETCIASGLAIGFRGALEYLVKNAKREAGDTDNIIITGGGAEWLSSFIRDHVVHRPHLVLEGLGKIAKKVPVFTK